MGYVLLYEVGVYGVFFFFSSRRRHTRFDCDWSSDVCSSDLGDREYAFGGSRRVTPSERQTAERLEALAPRQLLHAARLAFAHPVSGARLDLRSEWPPDLGPAPRGGGARPDLLSPSQPLQYLCFLASGEWPGRRAGAV